ncbi:MAG: hypothetical protein ACFFC6_06460 [Promethearchaeota archaeon]
MKIIYRHYEPNQGLEDFQAKIYSEVTARPTSGEEIRARYKDQKKDPKTTLYALTEEGAPLAYVQATDSTSHIGRTHISYPWALPACPADVQEKIFDELLTYLLQREHTVEITAPLVLDVEGIDERIEFFTNKGFSEKERLYYYSYDFEIDEICSWTITDESYTCRAATLEDLEKLLELCKADPNWQFLTQEVATNYFTNKVLKDGNAVLVFHNNQVVATGAILRVQPGVSVLIGKEERILLRFSAIRPKYHDAWKHMLIELANKCVKLGWTDVPLRVNFRFYASSTIAVNLTKLLSEFNDFEVLLAYQKKKMNR